MSDFEKEIKATFLEEAAQMTAEAEQCFLTLEAKPADPEIIDQLFRLAHNLKGSGNAVGFTDLGAFTHRFESLLLRVKNSEIPVTIDVVNLLLKCNDHLQAWIKELKLDLSAVVDSQALMTEIDERMSRSGSSSQAMPSTETVTQTVYPRAEEFLIEASVGQEPQSTPAASAAPAPKSTAAPKPADESVRVSISRLDKLLNCVGELVILHSVLKEQGGTFASTPLRKTLLQLGKATKEVQDISMSLRMIAIRQVFQKMQRIVRDTSTSLDKRVLLHLEGEDTEVDKTVLDSLGDPLVHLIRNAVDHGIETMENRLDAGKDAEGQLFLRAFHRSGNLVIEIQDDGAGLDTAKLQRRAIEKGILAPQTKLSDVEAYQLIFAPGFSTKTEVTDISGRGVGMDVVKTNIEALQGTVQIETELGRGTCFRITLPLTLAIIDGMVVRSGAGRFVVPLSHVHETIRPAEKDIHFVTGLGEVFALRGENLPLYYLDTLLKAKTKLPPVGSATAIVVRRQQKAFAVMVDEIVGQAQVVIKQLGLEHKNLRGFSGSAILGDGRPALILELEDLRLQNKTNGSSQTSSRSAA